MATAIETTALEAMRNAVANGWHEESLLVDTGTEALIKICIDPGAAKMAAQIVFNTHFKNYAGVL